MKARFFPLLLAALLCLAPVARSQPRAPAVASMDGLRKIALVIGNSAYANALPLPNSVNDANDVCAALRKLDIEVICKLDVANKRAFKDAIYEFTGKIDDKTVALFYFAGHGVQMDGVNYLIPTQAALRAKSDIEDESVQINYLMSELDARHAALNIFLLDACRNNPFISPVRGYVPNLGLASQLYLPRSSVIAMSTGPGELSLDGTGRNGTFTENLLKHTGTPRQTIEDMLKDISSGTSAEAARLGRQQVPQVTTTFAGRFCLAGCGDKRAAPVDSRLLAKSAELDKIALIIAQTKAKQQELDAQQAALLKQRDEIDALQREVGKPKAPTAAGVAKARQEAARAQDLDEISRAMARKQEDLDRQLEQLKRQQAQIDEKDQQIRTRSVTPPEETRKPIIIPAF